MYNITMRADATLLQHMLRYIKVLAQDLGKDRQTLSAYSTARTVVLEWLFWTFWRTTSEKQAIRWLL